MGEQELQKVKKNISAGLLAHVDAGKTTLAESMLYLSGTIRSLGRVDHGDAFLDTDERERTRGITIFSKEAQISLKETNVTLLDTPGHVDFSAEMERTLQVLDYGILIVSGAERIPGHLETLWSLLMRYQVPVFIFVNKMDQPGTCRENILKELQEKLSENCIPFDGGLDGQEIQEALALLDEGVMEYYLENGNITQEQVSELIAHRKVFPCYFGSALKQQGVEQLLQGLDQYAQEPEYPEEFGARVYKISRDSHGTRLTHMKITGGSLQVKDLLRDEEQTWQEKADQIRLYSGTGYQLLPQAQAGTICAVTGLSNTFAGEGLGQEAGINLPLLEPIQRYQLILPPEVSPQTMLPKLRQLEEEEPLLHLLWQEETGEIQVQLMGQVQIQVLQSLIEERFGVQVEFGPGGIVYKETITEPVEGVGHFEPLRHYAEVHLLLEPGEPGSGLEFSSECSLEMLDRNWQKQVLTHLEEKTHRGVLTGSEITDMRITLVGGRAHQKHTEGGDFRQATYRALRHGLKLTTSQLLEPVYQYRLEVPTPLIGRAMTDIQNMQGTFGDPVIQGEHSVLTGELPAATLGEYASQVTSYTQGRGTLSCELAGYAPCHNAEEIIAAIGYDSERDLGNPTGSVFCSHGAGFVVDYSQVYDYMHVEMQTDQQASTIRAEEQSEPPARQSRQLTQNYDPKELEEIFQRTYGAPKEKARSWAKRRVHHGAEQTYPSVPGTSRKKSQGPEYLLVDGYNIIFGWEDLRQLAQVNIQGARDRLMDILSNYQGYKNNILILVFDAYKVEGNPGSSEKYNNIHVVYTKEAETADQYIERVTHEIGRKHQVTVATSDGLEQVIILGQGAQRMSAQGLLQEIQRTNQEIQSRLEGQPKGERNYLGEYLPPEDEVEVKDE